MRDKLIEIQMQEYPDSLIVTDEQATWWPMEGSGRISSIVKNENRNVQYCNRMLDIVTLRARQYEWLLFCLNNYTERVFYECGWDSKQVKYIWKGCRFGIKPEEYISGYPN